MRAVFFDSVGLLAVWNRRDQWFASASRVLTQLRAGNVRCITTEAVLLDCGNAASRTSFRHQVVLLRERLALAGDLIDPTPQDVAAAWVAYDRGAPGDAGIVDHLSFAVMRRYGLTDAFTNDRHFQAAGFTTLF